MAEDANGVVREAVACATLGRPAPVLVGQPIKEFHSRWRPSLPDELLGVASGRSMEGGLVAGLCGVGAARRPFPDQLVGALESVVRCTFCHSCRY